MSTKSWVLALFVLSSQVSIGCGKFVDIAFDEAAQKSDPKIARIVSLNLIAGVVEHDGNIIRLDGECGRYDEKKRIIFGNSSSGESVSLRLDQLSNIIVLNTADPIGTTRWVSKAQFVEAARRHSWNDFHGRCVQRENAIRIEESSARLDKYEKTIRAVTSHGNRLTFSKEDAILQQEEVNVTETLLLIGAGMGALYWLMHLIQDLEGIPG